MTTAEIQERILKLKNNITPLQSKRMELFKRLKIAHEWVKTETDQTLLDKGLQKVERLYNELADVGVEKEFSAALFIFGDVILDRETIKQFDD